MNEISFHSLRHTATSLLKNAGVPSAVIMDMIGHDSEQSSAHYIDERAKRKALTKIPGVAKTWVPKLISLLEAR